LSLGEWFVTAGSFRSVLDLEDKDAKIVLTVRNYMCNSTVSLPRRLGSSKTCCDNLKYQMADACYVPSVCLLLGEVSISCSFVLTWNEQEKL
jgi:hypothetical protein